MGGFGKTKKLSRKTGGKFGEKKLIEIGSQRLSRRNISKSSAGDYSLRMYTIHCIAMHRIASIEEEAKHIEGTHLGNTLKKHTEGTHQRNTSALSDSVIAG